MKISVIICAYNPHKDTFNKVLDSLKKQNLDYQEWELIIIDNNSNPKIQDTIDISWHPNAKFIVEKKQGLIHARNKGTLSAQNEILVSVDDDTILFENYLYEVKNIYNKYPKLGIIGGRSYPLYETTPPSYVDEFSSFLAIRDLGEEVIITELEENKKLNSYPTNAPLLIAPKKQCMLAYLDHFNNNKHSKELGRRSDSLASGEDNDINLFIYKNGYQLGYFPQLKFYHIIPEFRLKKEYFEKMSFESNKSWIKVLSLHNILPWKPISKYSLLFRYFKAYLRNKAWQNEKNYIKWKGACGIFKGLSEL